VYRVQSLPGRVEIEEPPQRLGHVRKERLRKAQLPDPVPHGPERPWGNVGTEIRRIGHVQRIMPQDVESELTNRLLVGQILHLLQQNDAEHGVQLLGRAPLDVIEVGEQLLHRQPVEDLLPEQMRPRGFQEGEPFRAEMLKGMEHVNLFVVFDVNHGGPSQSIGIVEEYTIGHVLAQEKKLQII